MRPLSESTARVASKNFSRKYIALGRIVNQWADIIGEQYSEIAVPVKLHYRKAPKGQKAKAILEIACSASNATILSYQKDIIIERIAQIFGDRWITNVRFSSSVQLMENSSITKRPKPLNGSDKKYLTNILDQIEDQDIKDKLEKLGQAILIDQKTDGNS